MVFGLNDSIFLNTKAATLKYDKNEAGIGQAFNSDLNQSYTKKTVTHFTRKIQNR